MIKLETVLAWFLTCLILMQSCDTYREPNWTLKRAAIKHKKSTVQFKDSVKTYDYIIKKNDGYYGEKYIPDDFHGKLIKDLLIKDDIIAIRGEKQKDQTWAIIGGVILASVLILAIIADPWGALEELISPDDDDY